MAGADSLAGVTSSADAWEGTRIRTGKKEGRSGRSYVSHTYNDFSRTADSEVLKKYQEPVNRGGGVDIPFPQKLHFLLSSPGLFDPEFIDWAPHGRCIHIKRVKEIDDMQTHFKHRVFKQTQFTSFQRQLNLYGFKRITQGMDKGAYYHGAFVQWWSVSVRPPAPAAHLIASSISFVNICCLTVSSSFFMRNAQNFFFEVDPSFAS